MATTLEQWWLKDGVASPMQMFGKGVQREHRWLVTGDKGFADLRAYPPGSHAGVILLRPKEESRRAYMELIEAAVVELDFEANAGATIVITGHGVRVRRPEKH